MRRRTLLAGAGSALAAGVAGCTSTTTVDDPENGTDDAPAVGDPGDREETPTPRPDGGPSFSPADEPFQTVALGTREAVAFPENDRAHDLRVWNDSDDARTLALTVTRTDDAVPGPTPEREVVLDRHVEFPADGYLVATLNEPGAYELAVTLDGDRAGTATVARATFDCNSSQTNVTVGPDGTVTAETVTTLVGCPSPDLLGHAIESGDGECGSDDTATIAFEDGSVVVEGRVQTPTPCYDLAVDEARLLNAEAFADGDDDVLELVVAATAREEVCVECVGSVGYTATADFEHAYPSSVRVRHRTPAGERTVATVGPVAGTDA